MVDERAKATPWNVLWSSFSTITFHGSPGPVPVSGGRARTSVMQPVDEGRVALRPDLLLELGTQLAHRAVPLGEHVVRVDRLEVHLPRIEKVSVGELRKTLECRCECNAHRVLDEARLKVRVLDHEQLVGTLEQLVDR